MSDEIETIDKNPKSWAAWKREAERLQAIIDDIALAAMDSESGCLPLDYLQGHKDGLEWASQLAEANHPETGDWLYDDPIELAKAIRKGPDMPPVQPVADSEPDRNPVLAYADSYRDMAKQGVESVPIWSVITDIERNIAPLYLHAQPEPVVPDAATAIRACLSEFPESARDIVEECADIAENACRAAMLQELQKSAGAEATCRSNENVQVLHTKSPAQSDCCPAQNGDTPAQSQGWIPVSERMPTKQDGSVFLTWNGQYIGKELFLMGSFQCLKPEIITHWMPLPAPPTEVK